VVDPFNLLATQRAVFLSALKPLEKLLALALLDHWSRGGETFPSVSRLALCTGLNRTSVMRNISALRTKGAIEARARGRGRSHVYNLEPLALLPGAPRNQLPGAVVAESAHLRALPPVAESATPQHQTGRAERPEAVAQSDRSGRKVVAESDQGGRGERPQVVAESDPKGSNEGTQEGTQSRRARRPLDWQPSDAHRAYASQHGLDVELEAESFRSHHDAKGSRFVTWDAAFRTWLTNQVRWNRQRTGGRQQVQRGVVNEAEASEWGRAGALELLGGAA
jgi:hypothetical protein